MRLLQTPPLGFNLLLMAPKVLQQETQLWLFSPTKQDMKGQSPSHQGLCRPERPHCGGPGG